MNAAATVLRKLPAPQRRAQILRAAIDQFAREGFKGATTRRIALACGVSEAILFRHFPSKGHLYRAILNDRLRPSEAGLYPPYSRFAGDDRAFLRFAGGALLERMGADPRFTRILLYSALEDHDLARAFAERRVRRNIRYIAGWIRKRAREGAFRQVHPEIAARAFLAMVVHHVMLHRLFQIPAPRGIGAQALVETWADLFLNGMAGRRPESGKEMSRR